jgi:hypothetical protein
MTSSQNNTLAISYNIASSNLITLSSSKQILKKESNKGNGFSVRCLVSPEKANSSFTNTNTKKEIDSLSIETIIQNTFKDNDSAYVLLFGTPYGRRCEPCINAYITLQNVIVENNFKKTRFMFIIHPMLNRKRLNEVSEVFTEEGITFDKIEKYHCYNSKGTFLTAGDINSFPVLFAIKNSKVLLETSGGYKLNDHEFLKKSLLKILE